MNIGKRVYQKMKNKSKPDRHWIKGWCKLVFRVLELLHKKCKFNNVYETNSLKSINFKIKMVFIWGELAW